MKVLCLGEILLRLSPPHQQRFQQATVFEAHYGGSEANVATLLAQWGIATAFASRVPNTDLGRAAMAALEQGAGWRSSKVLYDRVHSGMATLQPGMFHWASALEGVHWLHWSGITPALSESAAAALAEGIGEAYQRGITISCDLNYRASLWQYGIQPSDVTPAMVARCRVLLGDTAAFRRCLGLPSLQAEAPAEKILPSIKEAFPNLQSIAMTRREGFSASHNSYQGFLWHNGQVYTSQRYDMPDMLDRVGGGDAFMAALIFGLLTSPANPQANLELATAAGVWKHYVRGDFNLCTLEEVHALMSGRSGARILR